jgi:predicted nucleotidyltransferase
MITGAASPPPRAQLVGELSKTRSVEAAALYGSAARGDMEHHSDIDLLILCAPGRKQATFDAVYPELSTEFPRLSLSIYSHKELAFLAKACSLFLLHLKREARILLDRSAYLTNLLADFQQKVSYHADFIQSLRLLDPLRTIVSGSPNNLHRLSFVYSLFRVYGVYLLADRGIFEFSKSKMASSLRKEYPSADQAIAELANLRTLNSNFFSGGVHSIGVDQHRTDAALNSSVSALSRLIGTPIHISERRYAHAVEEFVAASSAYRRLNYRLRTWFLLLAYDGLNIHLKQERRAPLSSFEISGLDEVLSRSNPLGAASVAAQARTCIQDYHLRYFLSHDAKANTDSACHALNALAIVVDG